MSACSSDSGGGGNDAGGDVARGDGGGNDTLPDQNMSDQNLPDQNLPDVTVDQGGNDQGETVPCGDVGYFGECDGSILRFCNCDDPSNDAQCRATGELAEGDCALFYEAPLTGTCILVDDSYGYDCGVSVGDACVLSDGTDISIEFCDGTDPGCIIAPEGESECTESIGTCDPDTFESSCDGDVLLTDCNLAQPIGFDCAAYSGSCDTTNLVCTGVAVGSPCGPTTDAIFECAEGLDCDGATTDQLGECVDNSGGDTEADAGSDAGSDAGDAGGD